MRIGFGHLAALVKQHGESTGARRYNGSGRRRRGLRQRPVGEAPASGRRSSPGAASRASRRRASCALGDAGPAGREGHAAPVVSCAHARRARRTSTARGAALRPKAEAALKAFQADHGLHATACSARRARASSTVAVKLEKARRQRGARVPFPRRAGAGAAWPRRAEGARARSCRRSSAQVRRPGRRDRRRVEDARRVRASAPAAARAAAHGQGGGGAQVDTATAKALADMASILLRIEAKLGTLVRSRAAGGGRARSGPRSGARARPRRRRGERRRVARRSSRSATVAEATIVQSRRGRRCRRGQRRQRSTRPSPSRRRRRASCRTSPKTSCAHRVARLDRALDRSRAELVRRYAEVEEELAKLLPAQRQRRDSAVPRTCRGKRTVPGKSPAPGLEATRSATRRAGRSSPPSSATAGCWCAARSSRSCASWPRRATRSTRSCARALRREARTPGARCARHAAVAAGGAGGSAPRPAGP